MEYSEELLKNFMHPKNIGEIKNPDGYAKVGNPHCGDITEIFLKIKENKIKEIKFRSFGCAAAIASGSILTQIVKGKTLKEAKKLTAKEIYKAIKAPTPKKHCSGMALETLKEAIKNYEFK
jgi:nitrogen fixation protein NifU and related proteins